MDGGDVIKEEIYKKRREHWKGGRKKEKRKTEGRTLREESEQYYFLYKLSLFGRIGEEPNTHLFLNTNLIFPCNCPQAKSFVVVSSLFLQILLVWARVERHNSMF